MGAAGTAQSPAPDDSGRPEDPGSSQHPGLSSGPAEPARRPFQRVAIVNRGEPAVRFLNAAREYASERAVQLTTIALYTDVDRSSWFVRDADEGYCLGPAVTIDPGDGKRRHAYLDLSLLRQAIIATRAEAVWVGWGFVAEDPAFAELCRELDVVFIGPSPESMRMVGDKIAAKQLAEKVDVPVTPWSGGPVLSSGEAWEHAQRIGFPLVVKAAAGGGGRGIRMVDDPDRLAEAYESARSEAALAFGDDRVFIEAKAEAARHIEVQIAADHESRVWAVGVRDCTVQRRNQKVMEESASTALGPDTERAIAAAAVRIMRATGYHGVGTVEFLYLPEREAFYFMEVNTRLQVEHTVTEATTGIDLVKLQLDLASGRPLPAASAPPPSGHAVEVRLNAEDPAQGFAPSPGRLAAFTAAQGPGVRVDSGVTEGDVIPPDYDSMIAKIISWGRDRNEALARLRRALADTVVLVEGGTTNRAFLLALLEQPDVAQGRLDTLWLDRLMAGEQMTARRPATGDHAARAALLLAAVQTYNLQRDVERRHLFSTAVRGRPELVQVGASTIELQSAGQTYAFAVREVDRGSYRVHIEGHDLTVSVSWLGRYQVRLKALCRETKLVSMIHGETHMVESAGESFRIVRGDAGVVRASSPGVVVSVAVSPGQDIVAGQTVMVVEAMKLESAVAAPVGGRVRDVLVGPNVQVDAGDPLLRVDVATEADAEHRAASSRRLSFDVETEMQQTSAVDVLRHRLLGYDVDPAQSHLLTGEWATSTDREVIAAQDDALQIFVDVCAVTQRVPDDDEQPGGLDASAEDHLATFMRSVERAADVLPPNFLARLRQLLAHYGVTEFERGPALDDAVARIFNARLGLPANLPAVVALLRSRLGQADTLRTHMSEGFADLLDAVTRVSDGRFPAIAELARATRFRYVDEIVLAQVRAEGYAVLERQLAWLEQHPGHPDRDQHIATVVAVKPGVVTHLIERAQQVRSTARATVLQALLFRHYRRRQLTEVVMTGDHLAHGQYRHRGQLIHLLGGIGAWTDHQQLVAEVASAVAGVEHVAGREAGDVVLELFFWHQDSLDPAAAEGAGRAALDSARFSLPIRRVVITMHRVGAQTAHHFTYRQAEDGSFVEQRLYRDLHPMIADRLELWRLSEFDLRRQPADGGVYVFRGRARSNPGDERVFALAEVHDLTPIVDERGRVTAYPELERTFLEAVGAVRRAQLDDNPRARLLRNRITLYVQPPWTLPEDVVRDLARRLVRAVRGSGLEQIAVRAKMPAPDGELRDVVLQLTTPRSAGFTIRVNRPSSEPIAPQSDYENTVLRMRRRGEQPPYELVKLLCAADATRADFPLGEFVEYDLPSEGSEPTGRVGLVPVKRPPGQNTAGLVVGVITNHTSKHPEGMTRVIILGDPGRSLGSLAEPECRRVIAALDLAEELQVPVEWFAVSSGARVAMDSGTENMDWTAAALRRIVEFTQAGREINVVVTGVNVGAQSYFNAEATMLMHTRGVLIMLPGASMVLTGKQSLDVSGGVSAEDNVGIGGYERVMAPNGQAQYWAPDIGTACQILFAHYAHTYVAPGERFPRSAITSDPVDRDVREFPHPPVEGTDFATVGDVFSDHKNPDRKKPFEIRAVMASVTDLDATPLERWSRWRGAEAATVWAAHIGGIPVTLIGIESKNLRRPGPLPADGPEIWTAGTLFPQSSKKVARAINAASGVRPLVVLANLSGFDGSPESMRLLQLEYGAEIGRATVNFDGPAVFCVVSRYHGGAFVVFSKALNPHLEVAAVAGSKASVLGGAPAAAVVFTREVNARVQADPRVSALAAAIENAEPDRRPELRQALTDVSTAVRGEKVGELAAAFDAVHTVERARDVGSVDRVIQPAQLRPYLIEALERGMARFQGANGGPALGS